MAFFFLTLHVRKTEKDKTGKGSGETGSGSGETGKGRATQASLKDHKGAGIELFKNVW